MIWTPLPVAASLSTLLFWGVPSDSALPAVQPAPLAAAPAPAPAPFVPDGGLSADAAAAANAGAAANAAAGAISSTANVALVRATSDEQEFLTLVNQERAARGLSPLRFDPLCTQVARRHSRDMADRNYFGHESPTAGRRTPMQRYLAASGRQPQYLVVGENLFYCSMAGVERGHRSLMASEGHRRNLLDPRYEAVGVGTYTNAQGEYWVTQVFVKRRD